MFQFSNYLGQAGYRKCASPKNGGNSAQDSKHVHTLLSEYLYLIRKVVTPEVPSLACTPLHQQYPTHTHTGPK